MVLVTLTITGDSTDRNRWTQLELLNSKFAKAGKADTGSHVGFPTHFYFFATLTLANLQIHSEPLNIFCKLGTTPAITGATKQVRV